MFDLIGRQFRGENLSQLELLELVELQQELDRHVDDVTTKVMDSTRKLHRELTILDSLKTLIALGKHQGRVPTSEIAVAEETLGVRFPTSYRIFLKHFGAAWLPGSVEIAGLGTGRCTDATTPLWSNVIDLTLMTRRISRGHIPMEYINIGSDNDCAIYLDASRHDSDREYPVIVLGPGRDDGPIARSFLEYVEHVVRRTQSNLSDSVTEKRNP